MNKPKDKIEELYQSHSDDFDKMPDDSLWDNIESNLPPVVSPSYRLLRWSLAAALLLFSLIGYMAYESLSTRQKTDVIGAKDNGQKNDTEAIKSSGGKDTKRVSETNESNLIKEDSTHGTIVARDARNDEIFITENADKKEKINKSNKAGKRLKNNLSPGPHIKLKYSELLTQKSNLVKKDKKQGIETLDTSEQTEALAIKDREVENVEKSQAIEEESNKQSIAISEKETAEKLSTPGYLSGHEGNIANAIPFNTHIAYETEYHREKKKESFFKMPSEVYLSVTPSLNYYRVFSNARINQFNGANNGGRLGWAIQAGAVYPLVFKRFSYRVGLSYFSAQSNFKYNMISGRQQPIRLNNNTFEYANIESTQAESKKWQLVEIQNDLMYKVRPMQDLILGFKAGSSFTERPVFDVYTGYRFSKQVSHRQTMWIEAAYAYAINAQQSSKNAFSYHMDKYSLKIGVNFR